MDSEHQNSWKSLYSNKSYDNIHKKQIYNQLYSSDKMMIQVTKTLTIFYVWWCSTQPKWKMIFLDSAHLTSWKTLYSNKSYDHIHKKQIYNQLYSSDKLMVQVTKTLYYFMFDDVPLNQNEKWLVIWIQHIKTVGKHSTLTNHMITYTRNKFITNFTAVTKWCFK